jgi:hypothetical protein
MSSLTNNLCVLIVANDSLVRERLAARLIDQPGFDLVGQIAADRNLTPLTFAESNNNARVGDLVLAVARPDSARLSRYRHAAGLFAQIPAATAQSRNWSVARFR